MSILAAAVRRTRPLCTLLLLPFSRRTLAVGLALTVFAVPGASGAEQRAPQKAERYRKAVPAQSIEAGGARIAVDAPLELVRQVVGDFDQYASFMKRYKDGKLQLQVSAKLVGRVGEKRDVYIEVPILKGASKVWGMLRFAPAKMVGEEELLEGKMLKGNVERLDARWRLRKIDESHTLVSLELLILPKVPVPGRVVTGELEFVSDVSVSGVREEAERRARRDSAARAER